ncbi:hypothetical protein D1B31_17905 [Neobacillus notoginsengisoli]|uniref:Uncharacterized protein n=1 Tax=Neobacillus notoginsengisoli TaxID=1578198 RepID=A0A417YQG6_9BACI|nr:hypothetical protein [Neobacillus notoginsengisoli]RHW35966.1 hypothetical protein D1B31_17905 [Neobacillus notoginsengisoli]
MEVLAKEVDQVAFDNLDYPLFTTKKGEVPLWDHPFLKGSKVLPKKYYPYTTQEGVIDLIRRGRLDDTDLILLKVLGDAICANEDQLRRYMQSIMSPSQTSKRLDRFRTSGLVDRWKIRIRGQEETVKPPAPFTLGVAGFKLLKHYYNADFFMNPNRWDDYGIGAIKRFTAMNEIRCIMTEKKIVNKWKWNAIIANNQRLKFPLAAAEIRTSNGNVNFLIDRAQMNQNFIGYFKDKLNVWKSVFEKYGTIPVSEFPENPAFVVIFTSTFSVAEHIHKELMLDTYPFHVWLCVEEDLHQDGFNTAFYRPNKENLKRIKLEF